MLLLPESVVAIVREVRFAGSHHLVGDLHKKSCHVLWSIVEARVVVDHPDGVHEPWDLVQHGDRVAVVKGFCVPLKCVQELHIVLGLVGAVCDAIVNFPPGLRREQDQSTKCIVMCAYICLFVYEL